MGSAFGGERWGRVRAGISVSSKTTFPSQLTSAAISKSPTSLQLVPQSLTRMYQVPQDYGVGNLICNAMLMRTSGRCDIWERLAIQTKKKAYRAH